MSKFYHVGTFDSGVALNVAPGRPAFASSALRGNASDAVDGASNGVCFQSASVTLASGARQWW